MFLAHNAGFQTRCSPCKEVDVWLQVKYCPREIWCSLIHSPGDVKGCRMVENWASRRWHEDRCALWWTPLAELALAAYFGLHCKQVHEVRPCKLFGAVCHLWGCGLGFSLERETSRSHFLINAIMTILISARSFQSIMSLILVFLPHYVSAHWPTGPFWTDQTFHYLNFHNAFLNLKIFLFCHPFQCIVAMIYSSWNYRRQQPNRGVLQRGVWARLRRKQVSQII